ncbi:hypothetical protein [Nonomuraea rosea]|uniref:hypothetical protein n=1 Tax=Nonomuraea rosea TaxID=638574 RepID=UPI0031EC4965
MRDRLAREQPRAQQPGQLQVLAGHHPLSGTPASSRMRTFCSFGARSGSPARSNLSSRVTAD